MLQVIDSTMGCTGKQHVDKYKYLCVKSAATIVTYMLDEEKHIVVSFSPTKSVATETRFKTLPACAQACMEQGYQVYATDSSGEVSLFLSTKKVIESPVVEPDNEEHYSEI